MGPRRFRRGCTVASNGGPQLFDLASKGPRRFRRGCYAEWSVEIDRRYQLQWGRDVSVADVSRRCETPSMRSCFNGAATFPSRMSRSTPAAESPGLPGFNVAATFPSRM